MKRTTTLLLAAAIVWLSAATRAADKAAGTGASFKGPLGIQLYSLRDQLGKDVPGTLAKVHEFGFHDVETYSTYGKTPEEFSALLKANHLRAVAGHFSFDDLKKDPEKVAKEAKALGLQYAGTAWVPHTGQITEQWVRDTAKVFNQAGEVLA